MLGLRRPFSFAMMRGMNKLVALPLLLAAIGCTSAAPAPAEVQNTAPPHFHEGRCDAAAASRLIGRRATPENGAEALRLSGAAALRWIRPGDGVTADYSTSRLNIEVDARERILRFSCG